ncbi:restriction endonuclease subunit S [Lactobacillus intestinalis]|uniref:restriction endonuclease subunit S n=1 Tax=Lactobacillus intestinalis TaxID=151781 RepID=UPI002104B6F1|nr:restriction endonuclease subunit S [Lactobacillus intestinalis]
MVWEQRKLDKIGLFSKGKGYTKKDLIDDGVPILLYGELYTHYSEKILNTGLYSKLLLNSIFSTGNEVVLPDSGETSIDIARASWIASSGIILAGGLIIIKPNKYIFPGFLAYLLTYGKSHKLLASRAQGKSIVHIHVNDLKNLNILYPQKLKEQERIIALLEKINKCIALQQRKLNDLNSMKSALLQDVFPNTQGIKKIKLSTQEWNLQKISSIFKERNQRNKNGMLLSVSISKGVYPFLENDRKDNSSNDKSNYKEVKINDLAYNSMRMWQGAVGVSKYNGIVSPAYTVVTPKKEENPNFYYYYFKNKRMLFNFRQHSQGLTSDTWNLKFPLFEKILIQVPSDKEEEQRISSLFKQIDKSIELSKIQIKKLTSIKQFLLQNMFI